MGVGDEILAAGQAQRLYDADPTARVVICDKDGKPRWHPIWQGNPIIVNPAAMVPGERVHRVISGPNCRPYIVYPFTADTGWTFDQTFHCRDYPARIYLTEAERAIGHRMRQRFGSYVLIEPYTKHENFCWPLKRWQDLVAACPDWTFVQHTHADSPRLLGVHAEPATFREACGLIASSAVYVRSESGLCHAAAALGIPQVTLFGGCMDADVMGGYPGQTCLVDRTPGLPCGNWHRCEHCLAAMDRITVEQVTQAIWTTLAQRAA